MGTLSTSAKNTAADAVAGTVAYVAAFTTTGETLTTGEVSGGSYARQAITMGAAAAGVATSTDTPEIPIPAGNTVRRLGLFTALTGGTMVCSDDLVTAEAFGADGTYTVDSYSITIAD